MAEKTKSEKLLAQMGKLVTCDICHNKAVFGHGWMMTLDKRKDVVCPKCQDFVLSLGKGLVSI